MMDFLSSKAMGLFVGWFFTSTCYVAIIIKILSHASTYKRMSSLRQSLTATVTGNSTANGSHTASVDGSAPPSMKRPGTGASDVKKPTINTQNKQEKLFYKASATLFITCAVYIFTWLGAATAALSFFTTGRVSSDVFIWDVVTSNLGGATNGIAFWYMCRKFEKSEATPRVGNFA
ncbi:hypothetical protein HK102_012201 [Quaeritorhiza haematococci]|nr:hypothetical protein HK102_012201 [Quaeritorhiza haematococci]